ncbi:Bestrophin, RFP-TM, chloride channel-domain-containing protein [Lentinula raphanica]|uniref:Bestrophin, RFP-TM, chloride channel-domain-containing protein n=1 Tax=Lentinula raphanica TaxID=153919 RepID=A0AA38PM28_9AGAR|nr:Bestrophin, RFP-TM, chloride channel-domain-containing protein [Lentinula raphanica]KAJ3772783.1 Bestrophin, RFP-TM, chloride channel-domain-containing protein [Lentinula raphanica]KAJ3845389.1 Bestrophin, RFP-TM, chloride channel-domain-containing protein [Lentinula raphanica]
MHLEDLGLQGSGALLHKGFKTFQDPYAGRQRTGASFLNALLATALFRCWHLLIFFGAWATLVCVLNAQGHRVIIQPTLLTVTGTVLGFVISYRTTSSFERYNEGRRLWSQLVLASRTLARTIWFHIPDPPATATESAELLKAKAMIEKKTVINLIEAFGVAVKHYLRGEDGIYYEDLYYLVKFLPAYALPTGLPSNTDLINEPTPSEMPSPPGSPRSTSFRRTSGTVRRPSDASRNHTFLTQRVNAGSFSDSHLPLPATANVSVKPTFREPPPVERTRSEQATAEKIVFDAKSSMSEDPAERVILQRTDEGFLFPAKMPPKYHIFDLFPFSLLARVLTKRGKELKGKKAAKLRAKMRNKSASHNLPLEISLYLSSYIAALQVRKTNEVPTTNTMIAALNQLVDSLTGLERILTTPIPFSYSFHLWAVAVIYIIVLPPQIWPTLSWKTIPATVILAFMFFGFLVAGEEIENPFGYDKNDLNLDHFTHNIIRNELRAITSTPAPDPARWAFAPENDLLFASDVQNDERVTPQEWIQRGYMQMQHALSL